MGGHRRKLEKFEIRDKGGFFMCKTKLKLKSSKASKMAHKFGHRKYECPICGHWHLTKQRGFSRHE